MSNNLFLLSLLVMFMSCGGEPPKGKDIENTKKLEKTDKKTDVPVKPEKMVDEVYKFIVDYKSPLTTAKKNTILTEVQKTVELYPLPNPKRDDAIRKAIVAAGGNDAFIVEVIKKVDAVHKTEDVEKTLPESNLAEPIYNAVVKTAAGKLRPPAQLNAILDGIVAKLVEFEVPSHERDAAIVKLISENGGANPLYSDPIVAAVNEAHGHKPIILAASGLPENIHDSIMSNTHISQAQKDAIVVLIKKKVWDKIQRRRKKAERDARIDLIAADGVNVVIQDGTSVAVPAGAAMANAIKKAFDEVVGAELISNVIVGGLHQSIVTLKGTVSNEKINNLLTVMAHTVAKIILNDRIHDICHAIDALAPEVFGTDNAGIEATNSYKDGIIRAFNREFPINRHGEAPRVESNFEGKLLTHLEGSAPPVDFKISYFIVQITKSKDRTHRGKKVYLPANRFKDIPLNYGDIIQFNEISPNTTYVLNPGRSIGGLRINRVVIREITGEILNFLDTP